jgi:hypothetical protein
MVGAAWDASDNVHGGRRTYRGAQGETARLCARIESASRMCAAAGRDVDVSARDESVCVSPQAVEQGWCVAACGTHLFIGARVDACHCRWVCAGLYVFLALACDGVTPRARFLPFFVFHIVDLPYY